MATHSSVLAWRIPGTGEPGGLPSMGLQSRTQLKWLSSSSMYIYVYMYIYIYFNKKKPWRILGWHLNPLSLLSLYTSPSIHKKMPWQIQVFHIAELWSTILEIPAGLKTIAHRGLIFSQVSVFPMSWLHLEKLPHPWTKKGLCNARLEVLWEIHQFVHQTFIERLPRFFPLLYMLGTRCVNKRDGVPVFMGFTFR